eukprot:TRINITY_DN26577_c0_g1_i1.p2 TRINITY_DN26577_c0_g1~~TRINITY_DN26577_c0_g1_i1.p2  ORF type:complete len:116 (-),score=53.39 TRINITY_DN26577_c0_g1_i1:58-405(-)
MLRSLVGSEMCIRDSKKRKLKKKAEAEEKPGKLEKKPKRAPSAYALFTKAKYAEADGSSFAEKQKHLGGRWKELSAEDKLPYEKEAAAAKAEFDLQQGREPVSYTHLTLPTKRIV